MAIQIVIDGGKPRFPFSKMHTFYIRNDPIVGISSDFFQKTKLSSSIDVFCFDWQMTEISTDLDLLRLHLFCKNHYYKIHWIEIGKSCKKVLRIIVRLFLFLASWLSAFFKNHKAQI